MNFDGYKSHFPCNCPTPKIRAIVHERDKGLCQYCGREAKDTDHVIPYRRGGHGQPYNLVVVCKSCNVCKGNRVWIPNNLDAITVYHLEWRETTLEMACHRSQAKWAENGFKSIYPPRKARLRLLEASGAQSHISA